MDGIQWVGPPRRPLRSVASTERRYSASLRALASCAHVDAMAMMMGIDAVRGNSSAPARRSPPRTTRGCGCGYCRDPQSYPEVPPSHTRVDIRVRAARDEYLAMRESVMSGRTPIEYRVGRILSVK